MIFFSYLSSTVMMVVMLLHEIKRAPFFYCHYVLASPHTHISLSCLSQESASQNSHLKKTFSRLISFCGTNRSKSQSFLAWKTSLPSFNHFDPTSCTSMAAWPPLIEKVFSHKPSALSPSPPLMMLATSLLPPCFLG